MATLIVSSEIKVDALKVGLQEVHGWQLEYRVLRNDRTLLQDERTLGEYGIKTEAMLQLVNELPRGC